MITAFLFVASFIQLYWLFRLMKKSDEYEARLKALEARKPEPSGKTGQLPITGSTLYPPVENFNPEKPETLRPKMVRGRDIQGVENVIEFDVRIKA